MIEMTKKKQRQDTIIAANKSMMKFQTLLFITTATTEMSLPTQFSKALSKLQLTDYACV